MKNFNKEEYNKLCAEFMGWEYFPESKSGNNWPDGCHDGSYSTYDIWVKNPTEKYREILCHSDYEYLDGKYNSDIEQEDLFDDYKYQLKYDSDWNEIMEVVENISQKLEGINISIHPNSCLITDTGVRGKYSLNASKNIVRVIDAKDRKEAVVQAIWEFLNWYNQQEK